MGFNAERIKSFANVAIVSGTKRSAGSFRKCVLDILRDYLECELVDKHGSGEGYLDRTRIGALYPQGVPHQENYVDCGLYLLQFAEAFLTKPPSGEVRGAFVFSLLMHWTCQMSRVQMLRIGVKWNEWYPWFDQSMFFMREKISRRLKGLCNEKVGCVQCCLLSMTVWWFLPLDGHIMTFLKVLYYIPVVKWKGFYDYSNGIAVVWSTTHRWVFKIYIFFFRFSANFVPVVLFSFLDHIIFCVK